MVEEVFFHAKAKRAKIELSSFFAHYHFKEPKNRLCTEQYETTLLISITLPVDLFSAQV